MYPAVAIVKRSVRDIPFLWHPGRTTLARPTPLRPDCSRLCVRLLYEKYDHIVIDYPKMRA